MRDIDIRNIIHNYLSEKYNEIHDTLIVDELNIKNGLARIDIAVINGSIHGYEIKSEVDTLNRLQGQIKYYNSSLERISIVVNPKHTQKAMEEIPSWWGVIEVDLKKNINEVREADENRSIEISDTLTLLWKDELIVILEKYNLSYKKSWNRSKLINELAQRIEFKKLLEEIRQSLKSRKNWRN